MRHKNTLITIAAGFFALNATTWAGGFQLYNEGSAEALAQAGAITARDDLSSLAWYNPAGLAGTEQRSVMVGNTFILLNARFDGSAFNDTMGKHWRSIPHAYLIQPINKTQTFTLSLNAPYGLITEWPDGWNGQPLAIKSELSSLYATPSLAMKLSEQLSVSAGFNAVYTTVELTSLAVPLALGGRDPNIAVPQQRKLSANDFGIGGTVALRWAINPHWALGARYQSEVQHTFDGKAQYASDPDVKFKADGTLPDSLTLGLTYTGLERWTFGLDAVWTDWSDFDQLVYEFPGANETVPEEWNDVWSIHLGAEFRASKNWVLRGGYVRDESPVSGQYRSPMLPGSDSQLFMGGFGYTFKSWTLDVAYSYILAEKTEQGSAIAATDPAFAGDYDSDAHLLSFSISHSF
ncbi:MAG: outer membrane protein transport protein [Verrucomicrobia bacterium]|nr:outer membrane protein transport protein [Verrucomicrobiota bacterium]